MASVSCWLLPRAGISSGTYARFEYGTTLPLSYLTLPVILAYDSIAVISSEICYLLSDDRQYFQLNAVELVKTCPCTGRRQTFEKLSQQTTLLK